MLSHHCSSSRIVIIDFLTHFHVAKVRKYLKQQRERMEKEEDDDGVSESDLSDSVFAAADYDGADDEAESPKRKKSKLVHDTDDDDDDDDTGLFSNRQDILNSPRATNKHRQSTISFGGKPSKVHTGGMIVSLVMCALVFVDVPVKS